MKKVFYEKVGRRYKPVYEYDSELLCALPKGAHIIMSYPGGQSSYYNIDPDYATMIAAGRVAEDAICNALYQQSEASPKRTPITERQRKAWDELKAAFGDDMFSVTFSSTRDLARAGVDAMQKEAKWLLSHPAVLDAWEKFVLVCKLTKEKENV